MNERYFILDVSDYQPPDKLDYDALRFEGVAGLIAKASQGNYLSAIYFREHVRSARSAGMITGAYHWLDPMASASSNLSRFMKSISGTQVDILTVVVEQYWRSWAEWRLALQNKGKITRIIPETQIDECAREFFDLLRKEWKGRILLHSRNAFIRKHASPMLAWLPEVELWVVQHPYSSVLIDATWEMMRTKYYPLVTPEMPRKGMTWRLWQITGDKFRMEHCKGNTPGTNRAMDINLYNGSESEFVAWATTPAYQPLKSEKIQKES